MSGIQEILIIVLIIVGIWLLPRLVNRGGADREASETAPALGGHVRLALLASGIWVAGAAFVLEPWRDGLLKFALIGLGPVALAWGVAWVVLGFRKGS